MPGTGDPDVRQTPLPHLRGTQGLPWRPAQGMGGCSDEQEPSTTFVWGWDEGGRIVGQQEVWLDERQDGASSHVF